MLLHPSFVILQIFKISFLQQKMSHSAGFERFRFHLYETFSIQKWVLPNTLVPVKFPCRYTKQLGRFISNCFCRIIPPSWVSNCYQVNFRHDCNPMWFSYLNFLLAVLISNWQNGQNGPCRLKLETKLVVCIQGLLLQMNILNRYKPVNNNKKKS